MYIHTFSATLKSNPRKKSASNRIPWNVSHISSCMTTIPYAPCIKCIFSQRTEGGISQHAFRLFGCSNIGMLIAVIIAPAGTDALNCWTLEQSRREQSAWVNVIIGRTQSEKCRGLPFLESNSERISKSDGHGAVVATAWLRESFRNSFPFTSLARCRQYARSELQRGLEVLSQPSAPIHFTVQSVDCLLRISKERKRVLNVLSFFSESEILSSCCL